MTYDDLVRDYWLDRRRDLSPHTVLDYSNTFRQFGVSLPPGIAASDIGPNHVRHYLNHLAECGRQPKTISNAWIALSALWTWAEREMQLPHILRDRVRRPQWRRQAIEPFTDDELRRLVQAADATAPWRTKRGKIAVSKRPTASRDRAIVLTLLDTGLRSAELCALQVGDHDVDTGRLHIRHGKGNKSRYVYLGARGQRVLSAYLVTRKLKTGDPLFAGREGHPLDRNYLRRMLNRLGQNAGVRHVHPHRFRHTFAITFLRNGGNIYELQRILGHETISTVQIYLKLAETDIAAAQRAHSPVDNMRL